MGRNLSVVHEITTDDQGARHGTDGARTVTLLGTEGRMFKRRAVKAAGTPIGGIMQMPKEAAAGGMPPTWGAYVTVDSVDACAEKVVALGGRVLHPPTDIPTVGRFAVIADPQGAWINIMTYTPRES
jgi:predicted enzyme related to lactoylglutathione lyase